MMKNEKELKRILAAFLVFIITMALIAGTATIIQITRGEQVSPITVRDINEDGWSRSDTNPRTNDTDHIQVRVTDPGGVRYFGWIEWNISQIPDTATIYTVEFTYTAYNTFTDPVIFGDARFQPITRTAGELELDMFASNPYIQIEAGNENQTYTVDLGTNAAQNLTDNLAADWFALFLTNTSAATAYRNFYTSESEYIPSIRVQSDAGNYTLFMHGLYYEDGTFEGDVDVTVYFTNGSTSQVNVNGSLYYGATNEIDEISWEAGQDARPIAWRGINETVYLLTPEDTYGVYQFDINDYSGRLGSTENYLETYRAVNGTWRLVERRQFTGIYNPVPALMVLYEIYKVQIVFSDGAVWEYGYFYPGVDVAPTLAITTVQFSDQARTVYQYIKAEATRVNATHIQLTYNDTTPGYLTTLINMTVLLRDGTHIYNSTVAAAVATINWYDADNETDYVVYALGTHPLHGNLKQTWVLDYGRTFGAWPDLSVLGELGGIPTGNLLAVMVGLILAGACSYMSAALAPFIFVSTLAMFTYLGGTEFTTLHLEIGFSLAILLGLATGGDQR